MHIMLLSIDIGIKNMSYCLMDGSDICDWNIINLCKIEPCCLDTKKGKCNKPSRYVHQDKYYCTTHSKKINVCKAPDNFIKYRDNKRLSKKDRDILFTNLDVGDNQTHESIVKHAYDTFMIPIETTDATSISLITIGEYLCKYIPEYIDVSKLTCVIIENQISTIASRMKVIQGMVTQYFICNCKGIKIEYISSINKLKSFDVPKKTYKDRKKSGIEVTKNILSGKYKKWESFFLSHNKKDDLADSFLQALWYLS
uniref:Mitochondrial resolvase Ydc2 catalytic domain-containing protein n=1 Tax=viral metagenome TaxID=1070528 RepID=A0A6C0BT99_9ZZZZ